MDSKLEKMIRNWVVYSVSLYYKRYKSQTKHGMDSSQIIHLIEKTRKEKRVSEGSIAGAIGMTRHVYRRRVRDKSFHLNEIMDSCAFLGLNVTMVIGQYNLISNKS